ncbi:MAG: hypothetical protein R3245_11505, partial [Kiloniellales bacterium]|nr:hypothetical protein [Kiloniellales bacterium]
LTSNIADRVLATESLLILFLTYPCVKAIHELGHGYAIKRWGGEVHELGVMFLVFVPVPYVDASASSAFQGKWQRALVGAAGIMVEGFLASVALFVWLNSEPGLLRAFAFNVMLIGGVSTILFNGNPLLRFDGYYVLADILEIPNLGPRSQRYLGYLIQRYLFGAQEAVSPANEVSERKWLAFYAVAAFAYRIFIMTVIVLFVASRFFVIGVLIAIWSLMLMICIPAFKHTRFIFTSRNLRGCRGRAVAVCFLVLVLLLAPLTLVPVPYRTIAEGVVVPPEQAAVTAMESGFISKVLVPSNQRVSPNDALLQLEDFFLDAEKAVVEAEVQEYTLRYEAAQVLNPFEAKLFRERLRRSSSELARMEKRRAGLTVRSPAQGIFVLRREKDLPGQFVHKGTVLGYVLEPHSTLIQAVVKQDDADLVRQRLKDIELRFVEHVGEAVPARVVRETPRISRSLPSLALSTLGGGSLALDPDRQEEPQALDELFRIDIEPLNKSVRRKLGSRVYIRFDHGAEPLANRLYRTIRQVFLERFNV